jgi:alanyl-tRNA synthetase
MIQPFDSVQRFIAYFLERQHQLTPNQSLVPAHDPSLLFINAGMAPLKDSFLRPDGVTSLVGIQRCVRAGGKHNDLDQVGYTCRHHTLFEMMGNFSFGARTTEMAMMDAWTVLTDVFGLDEKRFYVTYHPTDFATQAFWQTILPSSHVLPCNDNIWSMADVGPCGVCTELFYDQGAHVPGALPNEPDIGPRYLEIWNLVFMQYERLPDGTQQALPYTCIDTGMGLERLVRILCNAPSNYDTPVFQPILSVIPSPCTIAKRVIADHLRTTVHLIADGVIPSNEGRGYVLRRIIRRAQRYADPYGRLTDWLLPTLQSFVLTYPSLVTMQPWVHDIVSEEIERFQHVLKRGLSILKAEALHAVLPETLAFRLYDTYGFPLDALRDIARESSLAFNEKGFLSLLQQQKDRSHAKQPTATWWPSHVASTHFIGYHTLSTTANVIACYEHDGHCWLAVDVTPFYAESGGQSSDVGSFIDNDGTVYPVVDVQKHGDVIWHHVQAPHLQGQSVTLRVDVQARQAMSRAHSATHLLHHAVRTLLGQHISQKGSWVGQDELTLDLNLHNVSLECLQQLEAHVQQWIVNDTPTETKWCALTDALEEGTLALFQKVTSDVRMLTLGPSKELCGGTHVARTSNIGAFWIHSLEAVASGIRRIRAYTGPRVLHMMQRYDQTIATVCQRVKPSPTHVLQAWQTLTERLQHTATQAHQLEQAWVAQALQHAQVIPHPSYTIKWLIAPTFVQALPIFQIFKQHHQGILVVLTDHEGTTNIGCGSNVASWSAQQWLQTLHHPFGGKGGGKPSWAQGTLPVHVTTVTHALSTLILNFKNLQ